MMVLAQQSDLLAQRYYGEIEPEQIFDDAWRGMQQAMPFRVELSDQPLKPETVTPSSDWGLTTERDSTGIRVEAITRSSRLAGQIMPGDVIVALKSDSGIAPDDFNWYLNQNTGDTIDVLVNRSGLEQELSLYLPEANAGAGTKCEAYENASYVAVERLTRETAEVVNKCIEEAANSGRPGLIIDLRGCGGDGSTNPVELARKIGGAASALHSVAMIDKQTTDEAELLAGFLRRDYQFKLVGSKTVGLSTARDEIMLRSGKLLYVSAYDRQAPMTADSLPSDTIPVVSSGRVAAALTPDTECEPLEIPSVLFQIIHYGHLHDFVVSHRFDELPSRSDEDLVFQSFKAYLDSVGFRFDPLREAATLLSYYRADSDVRPLVDQIKRKADAEGAITLDEVRDEVLQFLLTSIYRTWIGGNLGVDEKLQLRDRCLQQALMEVAGS